MPDINSFRDTVLSENNNGIFEGDPVEINIDPNFEYYTRSGDAKEFVVRTNLVCHECGASECLCVSKERYIFCPNCYRLTDRRTGSNFSEIQPREIIPMRYTADVISYTSLIARTLDKLRSAGEPPFGFSKDSRYFII